MSLSLLHEITKTILDRGELSRADIIALWGLSDAQYGLVQAALGQHRLLKPGGRGKGGFVAAYVRRPKAPDEAAPAPQFEHEWQHAALEHLSALCTHAELEKLLGQLVYTVRRARQRLTGQDRRGSKRELAAALIIQHGVDLFRESEIRRLIGRKCHVRPPRRWHPGKGAALAFVEATGFPEELAGLPSPETPPDFEYLEGRFELKPLQDFQVEVQRGMRRVLDKPGGRAIVTLPTGAGKTRMAVDTIRDWLSEWYAEAGDGAGRVVLWLAHTEELCEQAFSCFRQVWQASSDVCPLVLFRFWGRYTRDLINHRENLLAMRGRPTVLISTPHRLVNLIEGRTDGREEVLGEMHRQAALVVIDEAHRAAAPTYVRILDSFRAADSEAAVIGLTATPFRGEYDPNDPTAGTAELKRLFRTIVEPLRTLGEDPRTALQERGYLATPEWDEIETKTLMRPPPLADKVELDDEDIERIDYALKIRADNGPRRLAVLDYLLPICRDPESKIIYFGPTVLDAECMAFLLRDQGVASAFVSGKTRDVTRRRTIEEFRDGAIKVLCNCEVLTTGFDAPKVTHVVMARPTVSQVLYEQMVGRGLRGPRFGGTERCVIIDCEDNYRADRPALGYRAFREIWKPRRARRRIAPAATTASAPPAP